MNFTIYARYTNLYEIYTVTWRFGKTLLNFQERFL